MKSCNYCKIAKPLDCFYNDKSRSSGKSYTCKDCHSKRTSGYYLENKEQISSKQLIWKAQNIDKVRNYQRVYKRVNYQKDLIKGAQAARNWRKTEAGKNSYLKSEYGITLSEYNELLIIQQSKCGICFEIKSLVVDHCHTTNKVRGLLCAQCNKGLGHFKDKINHFKSAIEYLTR